MSSFWKRTTIRVLLLSVLTVAAMSMKAAAFTVNASGEKTTQSPSVILTETSPDGRLQKWEFTQEGAPDGKNYLFKANAVYNGSFRSELLSDELPIYDAIYNMCITKKSNAQITVDFSGRGYTTNDGERVFDMIKSAFSAFWLDHPEVFWIKSYSGSYWSDGTNITQLDIDMIESYPNAFNDLNTVYNNINTAVNVINSSRESASRYDTAKAIHDYICNNVAYDYDVLEGGAYAGDHAEDQTLAPLFGGGRRGYKFVCAGYASSFKHLCDKFDIPCIKVIGEGHAWNYVQMEDNKWYAVDVTWDDDDNWDSVYYNYFLIGSQTVGFSNKFSDDHTEVYSIFYTATIQPFAYPTISTTKYVKPASSSTAKIITQPVSKTIALGDTVTLSLYAEGPGLTYRWNYKKATDSSWSTWSGHTSAIETATPNSTWNGIQFYCIVKDSSGNQVQSNTVSITFTDVVTIVMHPSHITTKTGDSAPFSIRAVGVGLKYQWQYMKAGQSSWSTWSGQTAAFTTAKSNATWDGMQVRCVVKNSAGKTAVSKAATLTLSDVLSIISHPYSVTSTTGKSVTFAVHAKGVGLTYQWQYRKAGQTTWNTWDGHTTASTSATSNATWDGMLVRCVVKDSSGKTVASNAAKLTLSDVIGIVTHPSNVTSTTGKSVTFTIKAKGVGLGYQWQYRKVGQSTWSNWSGYNTPTASATSNATWDGMLVRCVIKDSKGNVLRSNAAKLTLSDVLAITQQPSNVSAAAGGNITLSVKAKGVGLKYQWQYKKSGQSSWSTWSGKTTATITATTNSSWNGMLARCVVKDSSGKTVVSNTATVTVK